MTPYLRNQSGASEQMQHQSALHPAMPSDRHVDHFARLQNEWHNVDPSLAPGRLGGQEPSLNSGLPQEEAILSKEQELMRKAQELEKEMQSIKQAKIDVVVKQFEQQLLKDAQHEENKFSERLRSEYDVKINQLASEKEQSVTEVENLEKQITDQIQFFGVILAELKQKKGELESTHQAAVHQLRHELSQTLESQRGKMLKHVQDKREIFREYIRKEQL